MNDPRWASIDAFAEQNRENILRDITRLVPVSAQPIYPSALQVCKPSSAAISSALSSAALGPAPK
ncbi:hypothetical protein H6B10_16790, partial [Gemmiger formicilis]|nr:hypothetical protein [Gemmiger formicilis]